MILSFRYLGSPETAKAAVSVLQVFLLRITNGVITAAAAMLPQGAVLFYAVRVLAGITVLFRQLFSSSLCRQPSLAAE